MSTDVTAHAFRASDELATALRTYAAEYNALVDAAKADAVENPDHPVYIARTLFGAQFRGWRDVYPDREPPEGLSRSKGRPYLIAKRGAAGEPWRERAKQWRMPKAPWRSFDIPAVVHSPADSDGRSWMSAPGFVEYGDTLFVVADYPFDDVSHLSPHLTPVPLSEYHATREAHEALAGDPA